MTFISYHIISWHIIHRVNASPLFSKSTLYVEIKKFSILPPNVTFLKNGREKFKVALRKYLQAHPLILQMKFLCVKIIYNTVLVKYSYYFT